MTTELHGQRVAGMGRSSGALDRAEAMRSDDGEVRRRLADPRSLLLAVSDVGVPMNEGTDGAMGLAFVGLERHRDETAGLVLLGVDESDRAIFAVERSPDTGADVELVGLRRAILDLDDTQAGLLLHAAGMVNWHAAHGFCGRCGAPTVSELAGARRRCTNDGALHFPRTDPAVIMAVVDADERLLLARHVGPRSAPSTLAGFVEPGESLESAVAREVREECGVVVGDTNYVGSQPWPFPSSLMIGFAARATSTAITVDGSEISDAAWYTRRRVDQAIAEGRLRLSPLSISSLLIDRWRNRTMPFPT